MALYRRTDFVLDQEGRGVSGALVTVIDPGTGALASIFSDDAGLVPLANPFQSDPVGKFSYVAQQGIYRETVSRPGYFDDTTDGVVVGVLTGPQGERGLQGPQGERGPSGAPGADPNAANNWGATQNFQYGIMSPLVSDVSQLQGDSLDILGANQISGNSNGIDRPPTFYFYPYNAVELDGSLDVIGVLSQNGVPILPAFADTTDPLKNAGMIGFSAALAYAANTAGDALKTCLAFITNLAASSGSSLVGFLQSGTGAVARTLQDKGRERVSVKDFGAVGDGVADDKPSIELAIAYLKANGGGVLLFPGRHKIHSTLVLTGSVTGGTSTYTGPDRPTITFEGSGVPESGIVSDIASGAVIQLSGPGDLLQWKLGLKNFLIDCGGQNVTAINGQSSDGTNGVGNNHYVDFDGLHVKGCSGVDAVGVDFGTITDCTINRTWAMGGASPGLSVAFKINKANVRFTDCYAVYAQRGFQIQNLTEAAFIIRGGGCIACLCDLYIATAITYSSASLIDGAFLGEHTSGGVIIDKVTATGLDVSSITFNACQFDTNRVATHLMTLDFGGRFTITGCNVYSGSTGLTTVDAGQYCKLWFYNNTNMSVLGTSAALTKDYVNKVDSKCPFEFYKAGAASGTTSYVMQRTPVAGGIVMPFAGSIVGISGASSSAFTTGSCSFTVRKNGSDVAGCSVSIPNAAAVISGKFRRGAYTFAAGDVLDIKLYLANPFAPTPMDFLSTLIVEM